MLKFIAVFFMTLDHIGHYLYPSMPLWVYMILRLLGRIAFPIFAWSLVMGYRRTRNIAYYALRLFAFAMISEALIRWGGSQFNYKTHPNVLFTLAAGIVAIAAFDMILYSGKDKVARLRMVTDLPEQCPTPSVAFNAGISLPKPWGQILGILVLVLLYSVAWIYEIDYDVYGLTAILAFHQGMKAPEEQRPLYVSLYFSLVNIFFLCGAGMLHEFRFLPRDVLNMSMMQGFSVLALPFIFKIPQSKSRPGLLQKYFFYVYYPLHILLIMYIGSLIRIH